MLAPINMPALATKPFNNIDIPHWIYFYKRFNWLWWIQRSPMFLLAIPAAYGVGAFAYSSGELPMLVAIIAGASFEATYMGTIALGDQMDSDDITGFWIWVVLTFVAVLCSMVANVLFFSGGTYATITAESVTHGAPLSLLNFFYGFLLHHISATENKKYQEKIKQIAVVEKQKAEEEKKKAEAEKIHCAYCNRGFPTQESMFGHYRYCQNKKDGLPRKYTIDGQEIQ